MSCCVRSRIEGARGVEMIEMRRAQLGFGDGLIAAEVSDVRETWMEYADRVLADEQIWRRCTKHWRNGAARAAARPARHAGRNGLAIADPQARAQLELSSVGARSARQSRVPGLCARGRREGSGRQDHGAVGLGGRAASAQADPRSDAENSARQRRCRRPADARGHDSSGDQHPPSDRQHVAWGWGAGADPHHEEDQRDCGRGRSQAAGSKPKREVAIAGDRAGGERQRPDQSAEVEAALSSAVGCDEPRGWPGQALLTRDRRRREAVQAGPEATGP
jgi:hypothetical protein